MNELDLAYRAIAHEADTVRLAAPDALRSRADRRTRVRVTAVAVAAAVAVGSAVAGTQWVFRADGTAPAPLPPAATPSTTPPPPTPSTPPAPERSTSTAPTTPPPPAAPTSIPNSAFLQAADTNGREPVTDTPSEDVLPPLCGATFRTDRDLDLQRSRRVTYWTERRADGSVPDGTFRQTIRVYERDGASRFMDELREAVVGCPTDGDDRYSLVRGTGGGDESLMFERRYPTLDVDGSPTGGQDVRMVSAVRIGGVVTILHETGWEAGWSVERDTMEAFTAKAVLRLRSWLD